MLSAIILTAVAIAAVLLLIQLIVYLISLLLFGAEALLCWVIGILCDLFEVAAGLQKVSFLQNGVPNRVTLLEVFFGNSTIKIIFWGMAVLGIVLCFGFTIAAVIRKAADSGEKVKESMGDILTRAVKSIILILLLNAIITASVTVSNTLMDRIDYLFLNAQNFSFDYDVTFSEKDFANMAKALNVLGNYSLNAAENSRYNLNSCFNDMRPYLQQLAEREKFDVTYITYGYEDDGTKYEKNTWQSVLQNIYRSVDDISEDVALDVYNTRLSNALLSAMDVISNDSSFECLESYHVVVRGEGFAEAAPLERIVMLIGSMYGSGDRLTRGNGFNDALRSPYYHGTKDIFSYSTVEGDFDITIGVWNHLTVIVVALIIMREMLAMAFNAAGRIFNLVLLYVSGPPFLAMIPYDDGAKAKQWSLSYIIQAFGFFGTIMAYRLLTLFLPILFSDDFAIFPGSPRKDFYARVFFMIATVLTARKASGMIVGILSNNAAGAAASAGDVAAEAQRLGDKAGGLVGSGLMLGGKLLGKGALALGKKAGGAALGGLGKKWSAALGKSKAGTPGKSKTTDSLGRGSTAKLDKKFGFTDQNKQSAMKNASKGFGSNNGSFGAGGSHDDSGITPSRSSLSLDNDGPGDFDTHGPSSEPAAPEAPHSHTDDDLGSHKKGGFGDMLGSLSAEDFADVPIKGVPKTARDNNPYI